MLGNQSSSRGDCLAMDDCFLVESDDLPHADEKGQGTLARAGRREVFAAGRVESRGFQSLENFLLLS